MTWNSLRNHIENYIRLLRSDLNRLISWGESLGRLLNIFKCSKIVDYTIHDTTISNKTSVHNLGFHLLSNLSPCL
ncbi:Uncharacterized protein FWK35_00007710, partial [Aphis craccivora]